MRQELIDLEHLSKKYNEKWIVKELEQSFEKGVSIAFVGHNGCGKSTLLKLIAGLVEPTKGKIRRNANLTFAYVPENFMPVPLSARSYLRNMGRLDGLIGSELEQKITKLSNDFFVEEMLDIPMRSMSKGTLQKIGVIQALLVKKDVLLLDEPLSGQDEASQGVFVSKINELREKKATILMACHEQWLVDAISDQVMTIENAKLIPYENMQERRYILYVEPENPDTTKSIYRDVMKAYGSGFVLCVEESCSQKMIKSLISEGFLLRGMYDENSKFAKISASDIL